ncbi:MAG: glycosyltransferase [Dysosmobacter welbionis]
MEASLKKVIFTCGGTAGHVNPAIALAQLMREKDPRQNFCSWERSGDWRRT